MFQFIKAVINDFTSLLFPNLCIGCSGALEANEKFLCSLCRVTLPETNSHKEDGARNILNKFAGKVSVDFTLSYLQFSKGGAVQKLIHQIKYNGQKEMAREVGYWYGSQLKAESELVNRIDLLIGVPLHKVRLAQRGYNQADWITTGIAEALEKPHRADILIRNQFNASQTNKNRIERWENVQTVFQVVNSEAMMNKRVAVVDDVLTTGATIEACVDVLLKAGCRSVGVITLAVAK